MSRNKDTSAILDLGDDQLQFEEYTSSANEQVHTFSQVPDSAQDFDDEGDDDQARLLNGESSTSQIKYNFWSMEFYQQFFDVDTEDVRRRITWSMIPKPGQSFLQKHIRPKPDLYGPFWICVTLVFSIAISGNLASYFRTSLSNKTATWHYDFHKVTLAATTVFTYAWLVPALLYGFLWWSGTQTAAVSFLELLCVYGYSLAIYIPVSVLWLIQISALQWVLVLVGAGLSGTVLILTLYPIVRDNAKNFGIFVILAIVGLHLLLACGFMLYFFHVPSTVSPDHDVTTTLKPMQPGLNVSAAAGPDVKGDQDESSKMKRTIGNSENSKKETEKVLDDGGGKAEVKEENRIEEEKKKPDPKEVPVQVLNNSAVMSNGHAQ